MALCSLLGRRRLHDLIDAIPKLAEKLRVNVLLLQFKQLIRFFVKVLTETNVNISNELNFSDVYRSVNYIWSLAKFARTLSGFIHFARYPK